MTTLVVGATGATGRLLVEQLLDRGQPVRAIVRAKERLPEAVLHHPNLTVTEAAGGWGHREACPQQNHQGGVHLLKLRATLSAAAPATPESPRESVLPYASLRLCARPRRLPA